MVRYRAVKSRVFDPILTDEDGDGDEEGDASLPVRVLWDRALRGLGGEEGSNPPQFSCFLHVSDAGKYPRTLKKNAIF